MNDFPNNDAAHTNNPVDLPADWLQPTLAPGVRVITTTRTAPANAVGSAAPFQHFNLARHVNDDPSHVAQNRAQLRRALKLTSEPAWLEQVHGIAVVNAAHVDVTQIPPRADASFTRQRGTACVVMTADCLPVVFAARDGSVVGVAHAGWKGLCHGVIEALVQAMAVPGAELVAWLGPCIGPAAYETGPEIRDAFLAHAAQRALDGTLTARAFQPVIREDGTPGFLCDLYALARQRLAALGVTHVSGGEHCTLREAASFYSFRREPVTGRFATLVWRE